MKHLYQSGFAPRGGSALRRHGAAVLALGLLAVGSIAMAPVSATAQRLEMPVTGKPGPNEGKRPTGWIVRPETGKAANSDSVFLINRGSGYYLTSGPSSLVWTPKNVASGKFVIASVLTSGPSGAAIPDGFGVFLGGKNLSGPDAQYTEFLVRNDSRYAVFRHTGAKVEKIRDWTQIAGINVHNGRRDYLSRNTFRVIVDATTVQLVVNRALATSIPRAQVAPDGEFGMRIGTKQIIQIESLGLEKPAK